MQRGLKYIQSTAAVSAIIGICGVLSHAQAPWPAVDRTTALIAATRLFAFHSDPLVNLHDFLYARMRVQGQIDARAGCLAAIPPAERDAFERVRGYYESELSKRQWSDDLIVTIRYRLAGLPTTGAAPGASNAIAQLAAAMPAYRQCWWPAHDARNRAWIAELVPRLVAHEEPVRERLTRLYQGEWRAPIAVDVVSTASPVGANSLGDPDHILISSADLGYQNYYSLEMIFHEASHSLVGPGRGAVWRALDEARKELQIKQLPAQLWHGIIFYTAGTVVQARLAERGLGVHQLYMHRGDGVFPQFHTALQQHWPPYLEGQVSLQEAARRLVAATSGGK